MCKIRQKWYFVSFRGALRSPEIWDGLITVKRALWSSQKWIHNLNLHFSLWIRIIDIFKHLKLVPYFSLWLINGLLSSNMTITNQFLIIYPIFSVTPNSTGLTVLESIRIQYTLALFCPSGCLSVCKHISFQEKKSDRPQFFSWIWEWPNWRALPSISETYRDRDFE